MPEREKYHFEGLHRHLDEANADAMGLHPELVGQARALRPVSRAQVALAQVVEGPQTDANRDACLAEADKWLSVLAIAHEAVSRAIAEVKDAHPDQVEPEPGTEG